MLPLHAMLLRRLFPKRRTFVWAPPYKLSYNNRVARTVEEHSFLECGMGFFFAWDPNKARANLHNHAVAFEEATTVFRDTLSLTIYDEEHSDVEDRLIIIGMSIQQRLLVVVHTDRGATIRIISARRATAHERKTYEQNAEHYG
jgi:uncharacterized DUF497 family protein